MTYLAAGSCPAALSPRGLFLLCSSLLTPAGSCSSSVCVPVPLSYLCPAFLLPSTVFLLSPVKPNVIHLLLLFFLWPWCLLFFLSLSFLLAHFFKYHIQANMKSFSLVLFLIPLPDFLVSTITNLKVLSRAPFPPKPWKLQMTLNTSWWSSSPTV